MDKLNRSKALYEEASQYFPGGVNSPVRAFTGVGGHPVFVDKAKGAYFWDADGNRYVDYIGSWGPAIVGHAHPEVVSCLKETAENGFSFGAPTELETKLARKVQALVPSMECMRLVSSGTEACMSALRVARGYTGRDKIIKFDGCYHGHADMLLVQAGSGIATLGIPGSPGVPMGATADTLVVPYNDIESVQELFANYKDQIAAVIIEPIVGNSNFIRPLPGFLESLRAICDEHGSLLVFDEVMTGFRVHTGGVQALSQVIPDMTTLGKVIGGGLPIGAYGGKRKIMEKVAPVGPVYQAGTLSGNPLAVSSGLKTLQLLSEEYDFHKLAKMARRLVIGLREVAHARGISFSVDSEGGMFGFSFSEQMPVNFQDAKSADVESFKKFFHFCLQKGIYFAPSAFEAGFISFSHTEEDVDLTISIADEAFAELKK